MLQADGSQRESSLFPESSGRRLMTNYLLSALELPRILELVMTVIDSTR